MLFGVIAGKAESWGAHLPKGDLPEGLAGTEVSGICGSHGKSEVVGSNPGSVAYWIMRQSLDLSGPQLLPEEQVRDGRELCKRRVILRMGRVRRGHVQKIWILGTLKSFKLASL